MSTENYKDLDPLETREWMDAMDAVIEREGVERAERRRAERDREEGQGQAHEHGVLRQMHDEELLDGEQEPDPQLFNEYHALIVRAAKDFCRKTNPKCESCPLAAR